MEEWEKLLNHERAVRDAWCLSLNLPIPEDPLNGLKRPKGFWRKFNGRLFHRIFNQEKGHTSIDYEKCICKKERSNAK